MVATGPRRAPWLTLSRATGIVLALALLWRLVRYLLAFPLWSDEAFVAVNFLTRDLAGLSRPLDFDQIVPPGFLWAEWAATHVLGTGERALRLVPFLAGAVSLLIFARFSRQVATRRTALLAVALFAVSIYPARHGNEVKQYATDLLVATTLVALGWHVARSPASDRRWLALIATATAGVWLSYPAVFPAAGVWTFLACQPDAWRPTRSRAYLLAFAALLGMSFAAVVITFAGPQGRAAAWLAGSVTWRSAFPPLEAPWRLPFWLLDIHAGNMLAYPYGAHHFGSTATLLVVLLGARSVWRHRQRRSLLILLLSPLPFALLASALHRYPYGTSVRVTIYMAPAFCLLAGEGLVSFLHRVRWRRSGPLLLAGCLAVIPVVSMAMDVATPYRRKDDVRHRQIVRDLAARTAPGDRWIVFDGATPLPPHAPELMVTQWIQRVAEMRFYFLSLAPVPVHAMPDPSTIAPLQSGRTWLLLHHHGNKTFYPHAQRDAYHAAILARLGPPDEISFLDKIDDQESLAILRFPH